MVDKGRSLTENGSIQHNMNVHYVCCEIYTTRWSPNTTVRASDRLKFDAEMKLLLEQCKRSFWCKFIWFQAQFLCCCFPDEKKSQKSNLFSQLLTCNFFLFILGCIFSGFSTIFSWLKTEQVDLIPRNASFLCFHCRTGSLINYILILKSYCTFSASSLNRPHHGLICREDLAVYSQVSLWQRETWIFHSSSCCMDPCVSFIGKYMVGRAQTQTQQRQHTGAFRSFCLKR